MVQNMQKKVKFYKCQKKVHTLFSGFSSDKNSKGNNAEIKSTSCSERGIDHDRLLRQFGYSFDEQEFKKKL